MQDHAVADGYVPADEKGRALGIGGPAMAHVQDGTVLHVGSGTDADPVHIAPDHHLGPDGGFIAQFHVADHRGAGMDIHVPAQAGRPVAVGFDGHDRK
jgi:hypothetical protein